MSTAGWVAAGDPIRIPQAADVTIGITIKESVDDATPTPVVLTGKTIIFTVQRHVGDRTDPLLELASTDLPTPRLTVISAANGTIQIVFLPTDFPAAISGVYRLDLLSGAETAGKPYGSALFTVDAT